MEALKAKIVIAFEALLQPTQFLKLSDFFQRLTQDRTSVPKSSCGPIAEEFLLPRESIISRCKSRDGTILFADLYGCPKVMQLSKSTVVKFGYGISKQEATTQDYVFQHVDSSILRVPRVLDFFETSGDEVYIVMEFVDGETIDSVPETELPAVVKKVARAINHLASLPLPIDARPGPVPLGEPQGYMWSDYGAGTVFNSIDEMETWLNFQLSFTKPNEKIKLGSLPLSMRHMDIVRRNVIMCPDGRISFIDWQFAGFYPQCFEFLHLKTLELDDQTFFSQLLRLLPDLAAEEFKPTFPQLAEVMANNTRFGPRDPQLGGLDTIR